MCTNHEVAAKNDVENASHQKFDELRGVDNGRTDPLAKANFSDGHVGISNTCGNPIGVFLVETLDEDLSSVAADPSHAYHGHDGPVPPVQHCVRQ